METKDMQKEFPLVSIIMLNRNGITTLSYDLHKCIRAVLKSSYPNLELIFVDNGSSDGSVDFVRSIFGQDSRVRVVENHGNPTVGEAKRNAVSYARGTYLVFLDNDTIVEENWLNELVGVMCSDLSIGIGQSLLLMKSSSLQIQHAGGLMNSWGLSFGRDFGKKSACIPSNITEVFYAAGAAMVTRKDLLIKVGLVDPKLRFIDDVDLSWRVRLYGKRVVLVPSSRVQHRGSSTTSSIEFRLLRDRCFAKELVYILLKNYSWRSLVSTMPSVSLLVALTVMHRISHRRFRESATMVFGVFDLFKCLRNVWQSRSQVQRYVRKVSDANLKPHIMQVRLADLFMNAMDYLFSGRAKFPEGRLTRMDERP